ncbi:unnamed protein product [Calypogeia fissa]
MAALAPPPYRPSPPAHTSTAPSSTSSSNSAMPSKKQENLAAGRRRLEEFKRKKAAEKGKKTSAAAVAAAAVSDEPAQNIVEREQLSVPSGIADSSVSTSKQIDSNGHASLNNDIGVVSTKSSFPAELPTPPVMHKEHTGAIPAVFEGKLSTGDVFRKDPQLTAVSSGGGSNDGSSIRESHSNVWEPSRTKLSTATVGTTDGESGSTSQDSRIANRTGIQTAPLGASRPLSVPPPPPARKEIFGSATSVTGHARPETTNNRVAVHPSPFNKLPSSSQGFENSLNPSSQKPNGGSLVMLDRKLVPSQNPREGQLRQGITDTEPESISAKSQLSASLPPYDGVRTENLTDGASSTSTSSALPHSYISNPFTVKSEIEKGLENPGTTISLSALPPSLGIKTSVNLPEFSLSHPSQAVSEATASKHLPLPPPLFRPPISTFKPEPFVPPVFKKDSGTGTLSSTAPSASSFVDEALPKLSAPSTFQFPGPLPVINAVYENGKPETTANPFTAVLPLPSSSVGEIRTQLIKPAEPVDQPRPLWPSSAGGDDFSMLEQHIEDLTQEKFSLQRGLDSARALAETLAKENSALTEDFNNQGALVNDLKAEIERLQGEIRAQTVVVKNMKGERDKAVQDSKGAVERAQALAAEVIALEEKVLRARSQELKLQREMESLSAETEAQKRQMTALDKDRANLKTLMEALQEEKGLLQTQIRKATAGGSSRDPSHSRGSAGSDACPKTDASTSTDDFELGRFLLGQGSANGSHSDPNIALPQAQLTGFEPLQQQRRLPLIIPSLPSRPLSSPSAGQASGSFSVVSEVGSMGQFIPAATGNPSGRGLNLGPMSSVLPADQAATIGNINTLITELAEEKEALVKALRAESVGAAELRSLNAELSYKLEVQTQRLELAVAQSMANDSTPRVGSTYTVSRLAPEYVDEGDEVVERVLGWIMQLFPSGSSRRKRL